MNQENERWTPTLEHQLDKWIGQPIKKSETRTLYVSGHRYCGDGAARVTGKLGELPAELRTHVGFVIVVKYVSTNIFQHK